MAAKRRQSPYLVNTEENLMPPIQPATLRTIPAFVFVLNPVSSWHSWLVRCGRTAVLIALVTAFGKPAADAQSLLLATNPNDNTVGAYNAITGASIDAAFIGAG